MKWTNAGVGRSMTWSATIYASLSIMLAMLGTPVSVGAISSPDDGNSEIGLPQADSDRADAIRVRETFGFRSDSDYIERSLVDDAAFPNQDWGTPLTVDEAAEVSRQVQLQIDVAPTLDWADKELAGYAGAWFDHLAGGRPVFMVAADPESSSNAIADRIPPAIDFEVRPVARSYGDLLAIQERIEAQRDQLLANNVELVTTGIRPSLNAVVVGLKELTPAATEAIRKFGDGISIKQIGMPHADACPASNCNPVKAGIEFHSQAVGNKCTTGFPVKVTTGTNYRSILTAGHCFHYLGGGTQVRMQGKVWTGTTN